MISAAPVASQWKTPCRSAAWLVAMASGEAKQPVVTLIPSRVMMRSASLIAAVGLVASPCTNSILRPFTPPCSLIMSRAICIASQFSIPFLANGPVSGRRTPILIGCCAAAGPFASRASAAAANAKNLDAVRMISFSMVGKAASAAMLTSALPDSNCGAHPVDPVRA